jgi:hypothetical protein
MWRRAYPALGPDYWLLARNSEAKGRESLETAEDADISWF